MSDDALLLTIPDAARRLAVSQRMVETLVASGELRSVRIGRARRITVAALGGFVNRLLAEQADGDVVPLADEALRLVGAPKRKGRTRLSIADGQEVADGPGRLPASG